MERKYLDLVLVPMGLALMLGYHVWLCYRIVKHPTKTLIGTNSISRWIWVRTMMEVCACPSTFSFIHDPSFACILKWDSSTSHVWFGFYNVGFCSEKFYMIRCYNDGHLTLSRNAVSCSFRTLIDRYYICDEFL